MTRRISITTRKELIAAVGERYRAAPKADKARILDEFGSLTGYHRKHAIRVLNGTAPDPEVAPAPRNRIYDEAVWQALVVLWEAGDRICGKRLKVMIPPLFHAMERHGHLFLDAVIKEKLLQMSAASIDRLLRKTREQIDGTKKRRSGVGSPIRRAIPVRTFADWGDPPPGYLEVDMVEHCGGVKHDGNFVPSLVLTDIASGWTECIAMPVRNQSLVVAGFSKAASQLPFCMLGIDTDNDSAFINQTVLDYCKENGLEQTRSRAYKKNDNVGRTEKWRDRQKAGGLRQTQRAAGDLQSRTDVCGVPAVHQLLPTVIQAEVEDARRGARPEEITHPDDAVRPAAGAAGCGRSKEDFAAQTVQRARSGAAPADNPRLPAATGRADRAAFGRASKRTR